VPPPPVGSKQKVTRSPSVKVPDAETAVTPRVTPVNPPGEVLTLVVKPVIVAPLVRPTIVKLPPPVHVANQEAWFIEFASVLCRLILVIPVATKVGLVVACPAEGVSVFLMVHCEQTHGQIGEVPELPEVPLVPELPEVPLPLVPDEPEDPDVPVPLVPEVPAVPIPLVPDEPDEPLVPLVPDEPDEPLVPLVPDEPDEPEVPEVPVPLVPLEPEVPVPLVPDEPLVPAAPDVPAQSKQTHISSTPEGAVMKVPLDAKTVTLKNVMLLGGAVIVVLLVIVAVNVAPLV
jgi:hypothetical protein